MEVFVCIYHRRVIRRDKLRECKKRKCRYLVKVLRSSLDPRFYFTERYKFKC